MDFPVLIPIPIPTPIHIPSLVDETVVLSRAAADTRARHNLWQLMSQRANVDFSLLVDHPCAVMYATKYAAKQEVARVQ